MEFEKIVKRIDDDKAYFNTTHNRILDIDDEYVIICTTRNEYLFRSKDLNNFIILNDIKKLEVYSNLDIYDLISVKINELHISGMCRDRFVHWNKLIQFVKLGLVKGLHLNLILLYDEVIHLLELMKIPTLVAIKFYIDASNEKRRIHETNIILQQLEKSYHIMRFQTNLYGGFVEHSTLIYRNISIRNDWIHYHVLNFAIVMSQLIEAPYVLLEIFDQIGWNYQANHRLKIGVIERVCNFRRRKLSYSVKIQTIHFTYPIKIEKKIL